MFTKPLPVNSTGAKGLPLLNETGGMTRHPLSFRYFHRLRQFFEQLTVGVPPLHIVLVGGFLAPLRIRVGETGIVHWRDITKIAHDVHYFVVAEQANDTAPSERCFFFQGDKQVHSFTWLRAPVQYVAG